MHNKNFKDTNCHCNFILFAHDPLFHIRGEDSSLFNLNFTTFSIKMALNAKLKQHDFPCCAAFCVYRVFSMATNALLFTT